MDAKEVKVYWGALRHHSVGGFDPRILSVLAGVEAALRTAEVQYLVGRMRAEIGSGALEVIGCGRGGLVEGLATIQEIDAFKAKTDATVRVIPWGEVVELVREFHMQGSGGVLAESVAPELRAARIKLRSGETFELVRGPKESAVWLLGFDGEMTTHPGKGFPGLVDEVARNLQPK